MASGQRVNLETLGGQDAAAQPPAVSVSQYVQKPYDWQKEREGVRGRIALGLVYCFIAVVSFIVLFGFATTITCGFKACATEISGLTSMRVVAELVITPLVGLVGAVAGFYFGEQSAASASKSGDSNKPGDSGT